MKHLLLIPFLFIACSTVEKTEPASISWDTWGVPHIKANTESELFYAQGWAQMHNHANLILELYGSSRGKAAEYWGESRLENDIVIHTLRLSELADEWATLQDPSLTSGFESFVKGMNDYATRHPEAIKEENKQVLPIHPKDVNMHSMYVVFTRFIAGGELGSIEQWPQKGSNTQAVSPGRSASGNAMLIQNPHLPWWREFLFFESHLMLGNSNMYGATLVGFPGIAIGFNEYLGWSHTDNTLDNADSYELELKDDGYLLDGEVQPFDTSSVRLKVKQADGS